MPLCSSSTGRGDSQDKTSVGAKGRQAGSAGQAGLELTLRSCWSLSSCSSYPPQPSSSSPWRSLPSPNVLWLPPCPVRWGRVPVTPLCLQSSVSWSVVGGSGETQTPPASWALALQPHREGRTRVQVTKTPAPGVINRPKPEKSRPGCGFCFPPVGDADCFEGSQMWSPRPDLECRGVPVPSLPRESRPSSLFPGPPCNSSSGVRGLRTKLCHSPGSFVTLGIWILVCHLPDGSSKVGLRLGTCKAQKGPYD